MTYKRVLIELCLALSLFRKRHGEPDFKEKARASAQRLAHAALHAENGAPDDMPSESPLNLLRAALDYCDDAGVAHSEVIATVNSHARRALPQRGPHQEAAHA